MLYGICYLALAFVSSLPALPLDDRAWGRAVFATAAVFSVVLLLVMPLLLPARALRKVAREEVHLARSAAKEPARYATDLLDRGVSYASYIDIKSGRLKLSRAGEALRKRVPGSP
jgi:hypothetical protein